MIAATEPSTKREGKSHERRDQGSGRPPSPVGTSSRRRRSPRSPPRSRAGSSPPARPRRSGSASSAAAAAAPTPPSTAWTASPDVVIAALGDVFPDQLAVVARAAEAEARPPIGSPPRPRPASPASTPTRRSWPPDVDLVILASPPFFRPAHLEAAIEAGKHVFTEKPVAVDPLGVRSVIATSELAAKKGLAIVAGTQRRHQAHYLEIMKRVHGGDIGELVSGQCYWNMGALWVERAAQNWANRTAKKLVGHGVAGPQLALHRLGLGRPHRRAARPQPRRHELGLRRPPRQVHRHGRPRGAHRAAVRQHLRPLRRRVRVPERRARPQHVPADGGGRGERLRARRRRRPASPTPTAPTATSRARSPTRTSRPRRTPTSQEHADLDREHQGRQAPERGTAGRGEQPHRDHGPDERLHRARAELGLGHELLEARPHPAAHGAQGAAAARGRRSRARRRSSEARDPPRGARAPTTRGLPATGRPPGRTSRSTAGSSSTSCPCSRPGSAAPPCGTRPGGSRTGARSSRSSSSWPSFFTAGSCFATLPPPICGFS